MTREEAMEYRRNAPYDAFGDYSVFEDGGKPERKEGGEKGRMILCFELTMPNRGSWNGRWSGENDVHIITKTDREIGKKRIEELDGKSFFYRWDDGWTACVSCRKVDASESRRLHKKNRGFSGYDWMVSSIIAFGEIQRR